MNASRQRLRRFDWTTKRDIFSPTYSLGSDPCIPCRVKTTLKRFLDNNFPSKAYSYEISNIEILRGTAAPVARPSNKISMDVSILLNGVCDVNGVPLLDVCEIETVADGS